MSNGENTEVVEERSDVGVSSTEKPKVRKWVGVNIRFNDGHYLASFNHNEPPRVFHNMEELLAAIEVEAGKLTVSG